MSRRAFSDSETWIGTWRSDSENFALFCSISPRVAMRIVWLSAAVVTPRSAARSNRGLMVISGCARLLPTRGARRPGTVCHLLGDLVGDRTQLRRVLAAEIEHDVARIRVRTAALLALEADARVGHRGERRRQVPLELGARHRAVLLEDDVDVALADVDPLEHAIDVRILADDRRDAVDDGFRLLQRASRRHRDVDPRIVAVLRREEATSTACRTGRC